MSKVEKKWHVRHVKQRTGKKIYKKWHVQKKWVCSPSEMENRGICINSFQLVAGISIFFVIGAEKKNSHNFHFAMLHCCSYRKLTSSFCADIAFGY
jgi:hypothetical protein